MSSDKDDGGCEKIADECADNKVYVQPDKRQTNRPATKLGKNTGAVESNTIYRRVGNIISLF